MIRVPVRSKVLCCKEPVASKQYQGGYTIQWQVCMNGEITANNSTRKTIMNEACEKLLEGELGNIFES